MKKIFSQLLGILAIACVMQACKKDEVKTVLKTTAAPGLTVSNASLVLSSATAADTVETFSWTPSQYGYSAAVRYTLQLAKAGTNFASPKEIGMENRTQLKYSGADINQLALIMGLAPGSATALDVRVKSSLSDSLNIYSNKVTFNITPYLVIINYPSVYVPGDYQGWSPDKAPKLSSKTNNGIYEGYVNFPTSAPSFAFKITSDPDWNHTNYGWASSTTTGNSVSGKLSTAGSAGNLFVPNAGYYRVKANTNASAMTWNVDKTSWGLIGDAIPTTGWDSDRDMTYDATTQTWKITLDLLAGKSIKFRANDAWDINYGDTGADLSLEEGGSDIKVDAAGNYTVTLDLHVPGNYTYTVKKN